MGHYASVSSIDTGEQGPVLKNFFLLQVGFAYTVQVYGIIKHRSKQAECRSEEVDCGSYIPVNEFYMISEAREIDV